MRAVNISWDTDGVPAEELGLPKEIDIPDTILEENIDDYLSNLTGWCHDGYVLEK